MEEIKILKAKTLEQITTNYLKDFAEKYIQQRENIFE